MTGFLAYFSVRYRSCSDCRSMPYFDRELELLVRALEHLDRLAIIHMHEFRAYDPLEFGDQPLLDPLVEEGEVFLSFLQ